MLKLKSELKPQNNKVTAFCPINTKDGKDLYDWNSVLGHFVKYCYRKKVPDNSIEAFKQECKKAFEQKLDEPDFWREIETMYFSGEELYKVSPELLLFKAQKVKVGTSDKRLGDFFLNLLQDNHIQEKPDTKLNFLEREIVNEFEKFVSSQKSSGFVTEKANEEPYLPYVVDKFYKDLVFLNSKPKYFLATLIDFLRLYAFLYTSQLTINLDAWQQGKPEPKKCYFIMDNEKASDERTWVKDYGYKQIERNLEKVFPYLAMNESLQEPSAKKLPLWRVAECLGQDNYLQELNAYAVSFIEDRNLSCAHTPSNNSQDALKELLRLSRMQFGKAESRVGIDIKYKNSIETKLFGHFVQSRGRAGRVLVINQDYILLLTNLAIGASREQLRFNELIEEFESRGVFFDKQSHKALVDFYERIGNVERMSDSGDAVYVRKTV
ncbi:DNA phosphorothioation-dependent restriction protein DptG [Aliikangiella sp. IMCC44632]